MKHLLTVMGFGMMCAGCATVLNGSTQEVPVHLPPGTIVKAFDSSDVPLFQKISRGDSIQYLILKRNTNYTLQFIANGKRVIATIPRSLDAGWFGADLFSYPILPIIFDAITGAWYSFEGINLRDSSGTGLRSEIEEYDPNLLFRKPIGIMTLAGTGFVGSFRSFFPIFWINEFHFGLGYDVSSNLSLIGEWNFGTSIEVMPSNKEHYYDFSKFSSLQFLARYEVISELYGAVGGGTTHVTVDSLWRYDDQNSRVMEPGVSISVPTAFVAIGVSSAMGYIELRRTWGLRRVVFPSGLQPSLRLTSLHFGFNFHF